MEHSIPVQTTRDIPLAAIHVVKGLNVREVADDGMVDLIRRFGPLEPLLVRDAGNGEYDLVAGHRRFVAIQKLNIDPVPCAVLDPATDVEFANFVENSGRKDVRYYEQAKRFSEWRRERGMSCQEIAEVSGLNFKTVQQRIMMFERLVPELLEVWRTNESPGLICELRDIAALPRERQVAEYDKRRDIAARIAATRVQDGPGRPRKRPHKGSRKPSLDVLQALQFRLPRAVLTARERELVQGTLEWVIGIRPRLPFRVKRPRESYGSEGRAAPGQDDDGDGDG